MGDDERSGSSGLRSGRSHRLTAGSFDIGYNQGWFIGHYGSDMTTHWDPASPDRLMRLVKDSGGTVVRLWAFEGYKKEGIDFGDRKLPIGLLPGFLDNVEAIMSSAQSNQVKVYWTALTGEWKEEWNAEDEGRWRQIHYNILNNINDARLAFQERVLRPFVERMDRYKDFVYGLDLMNEFQASSDFWGGNDFGQWHIRACNWIRQLTNFLHGIAPWLQVTASARGRVRDAGNIVIPILDTVHHLPLGSILDADGIVSSISDPAGIVAPIHPYNGSDMILNHLRELPIDFYDLHHYNDIGGIYKVSELKSLSEQTRKPIILGEFGQQDENYNDDLKSLVTTNFLTNAWSNCFKGALAWRLEDGRKRNTFYLDGRPRPAVDIIKQFPRQLITR